jgi:hypothetical protein
VSGTPEDQKWLAAEAIIYTITHKRSRSKKRVGVMEEIEGEELVYSIYKMLLSHGGHVLPSFL